MVCPPTPIARRWPCCSINVACRLDTIADQPGHARISMPQVVYLGHRAVDGAAATTLQAMTLPVIDLGGALPNPGKSTGWRGT